VDAAAAIAPKPSDAEAEHVEPDVKAKPLERVQPLYTDEARAAGIEGPVKVELTVNELGDVIEVRVIQGLGHGLDQAAMTAFKRWKFSPAMKNGKPIRTKFVITSRFQLGD
jgi:TonB family protein